MARPSPAVRQVDYRLPTFQPLGQERCLRRRFFFHIRPVWPGSGHGGRRLRQGSSARRRRPKRGRPPGESQATQAIGRSRVGLATKIIASPGRAGRFVKFKLKPGNAAEVSESPTLLSDAETSELLADKAHDSDAVPLLLASMGIIAAIRPVTARSPTGPATWWRTPLGTPSNSGASPPRTPSWGRCTRGCGALWPSSPAQEARGGGRGSTAGRLRWTDKMGRSCNWRRWRDTVCKQALGSWGCAAG